MSKFKSNLVEVIVQLENGKEIKCKTTFVAEGSFKRWKEDMHPDGLGYYETFIDINIDDDTIEPEDATFYEDSEETSPIKKIVYFIGYLEWELIDED